MDICKQMPKTDLHCNLDGGFDIDFLYKELSHPEIKDILKETHDFRFSTREELLTYVGPTQQRD